MKRFVWPLERLLDVTRRREELLQAEMAKLLAEIERLRNEVSRRRGLLQRMLVDLAAQPLEKRLPGQQTFLAFATSVEREIAGLEGQIAQLQATRARTNERLQKERMQRQTLERLRQLRGELNGHAERVNVKRAPCGLAAVLFSI